MAEQDRPPERFYDENGRPLGVNESEEARGRWYAERGLADPVKATAAAIAAASKAF